MHDRGKGLIACHLTSPGAVLVRTSKATAAFDPGPGAPAAVFIDEKGARCVVAMNPALFSRANDRPYN